MDFLYLALNCQKNDYTKTAGLFFNICQNKLNHNGATEKVHSWE